LPLLKYLVKTIYRRQLEITSIVWTFSFSKEHVSYL
jgi:hypothetical protein